MIRVIAVTKNQKVVTGFGLDILKEHDIHWYWADFSVPTVEEVELLDTYFHFHPLAIEDCLHFLQRPKLEYYDNHSFLVVHAINQQTLEVDEVDLFVGENFVVSFHLNELQEVNSAWTYFQHSQSTAYKSPMEVAYKIIDKLVDVYFPVVYSIEDRMKNLGNNDKKGSMPSLINETFEIRENLLHLHYVVTPMRDLLYRMLESKRFLIESDKKVYFQDVYDHLIKLGQMIETNRSITAEIRDNYISLNSYHMNSIMKTLTVITTIFMPLTFIAGIYGMNFANMPELSWKYGYFLVLGVMAATGIGMFLWFRKKGWFKNE